MLFKIDNKKNQSFITEFDWFFDNKTSNKLV